jgi:tetratricopeptide (TPR) repeat protein
LRQWSVAICVVVCLLGQAGCLEMVRRPQERAADAWLTDNEPAVASHPDASQFIPASQDTAREAGAVSVALHGTGRGSGLPRSAQQRIRRVNDYSLWCIRQGMWREARSHMEQALARDSLAASLYNNLAIVYEHYGVSDSAAAFYQRALELGDGAAQYRRNLDRLERHQDAAGDTTQTIDLFELKKRTPGPQQAPY